MRSSRLPLLAALLLLSVAASGAPVPAAPDITLDIGDYATMPMTGKVDGKGQVMGLLARANFMREEPGVARNRIFVNDLNGPLYILDKQTGKFTTYLNFNGRDGQPGLFRRLPTEAGFGNGFICFTFDPDYAHNGKFWASSPGGSGGAGRRNAGQYELPRPAPGSACVIRNHAGDSDARANRPRGSAHRMDRHQHVQCDL